jgi:curved DNA-binding protein CbpA
VNGRLQDEPLPLLLQQLRASRLTGVLRIETRTGRHELYVREGFPVSVQLPGSAELLGNVLREMGMIDDATHKRTLASPPPEGMRYGEWLLEQRLIAPDQLRLALKAQVRRKLHRLFFLPDGEFRFEQVTHLEGMQGSESLTVQPSRAIYHGVRSAWSAERLESALFLLDGRALTCTLAPEAVARYGLGNDDGRVAELLRRGYWLMPDLIEAAGLAAQPVHALVYALYVTEALDVRGADEVPRLKKRADGANPPAATTMPGARDSNPGLAAGSNPEWKMDMSTPVGRPASGSPSSSSYGSGSPSSPNLGSRSTSSPNVGTSSPSSPNLGSRSTSSPNVGSSSPSSPNVGSSSPSSPNVGSSSPSSPNVGSSSPSSPNVGSSSPSSPNVGSRATSSPNAGSASPSSPRVGTTPPAPGASPSTTVPGNGASTQKPGSDPTMRATTSYAAPQRNSGSNLTITGESSLDQLKHQIALKARVVEAENLFEVLGVPETATAEQVKAAYFDAAKRYHPDRLKTLELESLREAVEKIFRRVGEAYGQLFDDKLRADYKASLGRSRDADPEAHAKAMKIIEAEMAMRRGEIALKRGDFASALRELEAAVAGNPTEGEHLSVLAFARVCAGQTSWGEAKAQFAQGARLSPKSGRTYYYLGLANKETGEQDKAYNYFRKAIDLDPRLIDAEREMRLINMRKEKNEKKGLFDRFRKKP